ncbi:MAG: ABC transporter permease [Nitrospira sp.]
MPWPNGGNGSNARQVRMLRSLWDYRFFVLTSVWNDFYVRFVRSKLGGAWLVLHPLSQVMIYAFILSNLLASRIPGVSGIYGYAVYLMAGLLAWNLFSEVMDRCLKVFVKNANIIKKVSFPRITLPIIEIGSAILNNIVLLSVMIVIFAFLGHKVSWSILSLFLLIPIVAVLAAGIGVTLGILNVFIRDIEQVVPIILQITFWFTPIVYPAASIPEKYLSWLEISPIFQLVTAYHEVIVYHRFPSVEVLAGIGVLAALLCGFALFLFRRATADMVDVL